MVGHLNAEHTADQPAQPAFRVCLNTSTIRGQKLTVDRQIDVAAQAGFEGIEPWMGDLRGFVESGGKLSDLRKQLEDANLRVESAIGFAKWIVDDPAVRQEGLEEFQRDADLIRSLGGTRMAAPPVGAHDAQAPRLDTQVMAERYRTVLELGEKIGVIPMAEVWGFSKNMSRLSETASVIMESGHPAACLLPDFYHLYRGGSAFEGVSLLSQQAIHVFHINDYPARERTTLNDRDRVYPGDGDCPIVQVLRSLIANEVRCVLSLELFNETLWKQDALEVCRVGAAKIRELIARAESSES